MQNENLHIYKIIYKNSLGHIAKCQDCNNYQLFVGTTIVAFTEKQLHNFIHDMELTNMEDPRLWVSFGDQKKALISLMIEGWYNL